MPSQKPGEKRYRFSMRKLSIGLVSATIGSFFLLSVAQPEQVSAQESREIGYHYVTEAELTTEEKNLVVKELPNLVKESDADYFLVYRPQQSSQALPQTGDFSLSNTLALVVGAGLLLLAVKVGKNGRKKLAGIFLLTSLGSQFVSPTAFALTSEVLKSYNQFFHLSVGEQLPQPVTIDGYEYVGYIRTEKLTRENSSTPSSTPAKPMTSEQVSSNNQTQYGNQLPTDQEDISSPGTTPVPQDGGNNNGGLSPKDEPSSDVTVAKGNQSNNGQANVEPSLPSHDDPLPAVTAKGDQSNNGQANVEPSLPSYDESLPSVTAKGDQSNNGQANVEPSLPSYDESLPSVTAKGDQSNNGQANVEPSLPSYDEPLPSVTAKGDQSNNGQANVEPSLPSYEDSQTPVTAKGDQSNNGQANVEEKLPTLEIEQETRTEEIPVTTIEEEDANLPIGSQKTIAGTPGEKTITRDYIKLETGERGELLKEETKVTKEMVPTRIVTGTKEVVEELPKKIELKDITGVELYRKENNQYTQLSELAEKPTQLSNYYVKVKSDRFGDTFLPVSTVTDTVKDGKSYYEFTTLIPELAQAGNTSDYTDGYKFLIDRYVPASNNIYYSVSELITAMNANRAGTYILGNNMDLSALSVPANQSAYVTGEFTGTVTGKNGDKQFAFYNGSLPLFDTLKKASVENLALKAVQIKGGQDIGALAKTADASTITNVSVEGMIQASRNIGGVVNLAQNGSKLENITFEGSIKAPANTAGSSKIGGLVGRLNSSSLNKGHAKVDIEVNQTNNNNYATAGLVADVTTTNGQPEAHLQNAYAEGTITNAGGGRVAGLVSSNWQNGRVSNVLSDVRVTKGNKTYADDGALGNNHHARLLTNFYVTADATGTPERASHKVTTLSKDEAIEKIKTFDITNVAEGLPKVLQRNNEYIVDYSKVRDFKAENLRNYRNVEKLIPFYNKEQIVKYGNLLSDSQKLHTTDVLSVTPMTSGRFTPMGNAIDQIFVHYADGTKEIFNVADKTSFTDQLQEYKIPELGLLYTPRLSVNESFVKEAKEALSQVELYSDPVYVATNRTTNAKAYIQELYMDEGMAKLKDNLDKYVPLLLEHGVSPEKILANKEKIALGLTYMNQLYNVKFGDYRLTDLLLTDFYGKKQDLADMLIAIGSDYNKLQGRNSATTFDNVIANHTPAKNLKDFFAYNRQLFTNFATDDEWFKDAVKGKVVIEERASEVEEIKQAEYRAYPKLLEGEFVNYLLPMLNIEKSKLYVISNYSTLVFGSKDRKPKDTEEAWLKAISESADAFRNYIDTWYRIAEENVKGRLVQKRNLPIWDGYLTDGNKWTERFGNMGQANEYSSIREFFGPIGKYFPSNGLGAYANMGNNPSVHYITLDVLTDYGQSVFTHEVTHVYDTSIYLGGYARREGQGAEAYAQGLLQSPRNGGELGINLMFKYPMDGTRWYNPTPEQFHSKADIDRYMKRYIDTLMVLGHAETDAVLGRQNQTLINSWFKKVDKKLKTDDKDKNNDTDQFDVVRSLNDTEKAEAGQIKTIDDLIDRNYMSNKYIGNGNYDGNGIGYDAYVTPHMLTNFYGGNTSQGAAGAVMFKANSFYMWGYYGYTDGFLSYASNKYQKDAKAAGVRLNDQFIIEKVSNGQFKTLEDWKKAYYKETKEKAQAYFKPVTVNGQTINSYQDLVNQINTILSKYSLDNEKNITSAMNEVYSLKEKVYKQWLKDTDAFQTNTIGQ